MKPLNARQQAFVNEYCRRRNASKAARKAGYNPDNAGQIGWQLLNETRYKHVQEAIRQKLDDGEAQRKILHDLMTGFLVQTIDFDIGDLKDGADEWLPLEMLDPEDRKQISSLQDNKYENEGGQNGRSISMRFANKLEAVKILGKHTGYFAAGETAGQHTAYRDARENLSRMFDRVRRRAQEPAPGTPDAGGGG